jgi:MerR family transcriptional regulator, mercuric resistance operon regulatory protein
MQEPMTIGRLAKLAGVNVETVRYYQRRGLLREPSKPAGGQRRYSPAVLQQIGFIRRAQQLGFSLEEVKSLMLLSDARDSRDALKLAESKYESLGARIVQLNGMRRQLKRLIAACERRARGEPCPLIAELSKPG